METNLTLKSQTRSILSFEDLEDESFKEMQWNPGKLRKAIPKSDTRIKKMKSK